MSTYPQTDTQIGCIEIPNLISGTIEILLDKDRGTINLLRNDDPLLFLQCVHYRKKYARVGLHILFNDQQEPIEYDTLVGVENMAYWGFCRDFARREMEATERAEELRRREMVVD